MKKEQIVIETKKNPEVFSKEEVTFHAIKAMYKRRPMFITPVYDENYGDYRYGLADVSRAMIDAAGTNILPEYTSQMQIRNMEKIVLKKTKDGKYIPDKDFIKWNLALLQKEVAHSKGEVSPSKHNFFINNIEAEAKVNVDKRKTVIKASAKVADLNSEQIVDMLYFFGYNPRTMSMLVQESTAYGLVDERPEDILSYFERSTESNRITFIKKLLSAKIVNKDANGLITCSLGTLGFGEEAAAAFVYDEKNDKVFDSLTNALENKTKE